MVNKKIKVFWYTNLNFCLKFVMEILFFYDNDEIILLYKYYK